MTTGSDSSPVAGVSEADRRIGIIKAEVTDLLAGFPVALVAVELDVAGRPLNHVSGSFGRGCVDLVAAFPVPTHGRLHGW